MRTGGVRLFGSSLRAELGGRGTIRRRANGGGVIFHRNTLPPPASRAVPLPMLRIGRSAVAAVLLGIAVVTPAIAQDKTPPYWASIASGEAMMRTGPGRNYPGIWLYK